MEAQSKLCIGNYVRFYVNVYSKSSSTRRVRLHLHSSEFNLKHKGDFL